MPFFMPPPLPGAAAAGIALIMQSPLSEARFRQYGGRVTGKWRHDLLAAQQIGLPSAVGLLLVAAGLSAVLLPWLYGSVVGVVGLALIGTMLYRNVRRRQGGIDGWPNTLILAPSCL